MQQEGDGGLRIRDVPVLVCRTLRVPYRTVYASAEGLSGKLSTDAQTVLLDIPVVGRIQESCPMETFTRTELEEASHALISLLSKCEKAHIRLTPGTSQYTLLTRRIEALRIAIELIQNELKK